MICEKCKTREATVHYTEILNGQKRQLNLCSMCAGELNPQGINFMPQLNFHSFLGGLMGHSIGAFTKTPTKSKSCEVCGLSEVQFAKKGLLGCAKCYENFNNTIESLVRRIHGTNKHTGKVPARAGGRIKLVREIEQLRNQLREAIRTEEFEKAAGLRDLIKAKEQELGRGDGDGN